MTRNSLVEGYMYLNTHSGAFAIRPIAFRNLGQTAIYCIYGIDYVVVYIHMYTYVYICIQNVKLQIRNVKLQIRNANPIN